MFTRRLGATENPQQRGTVLIGNGSAQLFEVVGKVVNDTKNRITVRQKNIVPHHRIAGRNPGEIPEATGGVPEDVHVLIFTRQGIYQGERDQVRQVAGGCQHLIVIRHRHGQHRGTAALPEPLQASQVGLADIVRRRKDDLVVGEKLGICRPDATLLGTGNGMTGNNQRRQAAEHGLNIGYEAGFGTTDIGEYRVRLQRRANLLKNRACCSYRNGKHNQVRATNCIRHR